MQYVVRLHRCPFNYTIPQCRVASFLYLSECAKRQLAPSKPASPLPFLYDMHMVLLYDTIDIFRKYPQSFFKIKNKIR